MPDSLAPTYRRLALACTALLGLATIGAFIRARRRKARNEQLRRAEDELHPLLKDHTTFRSYTTRYGTYPSIRTFYRRHSHLAKHENLSSLPLLVFIHGLGGVLPQFAPIIGSLSNIAACLGIELPGHGRSAFEPRDFTSYSLAANVTLWKTVIEAVCQENGHQSVVLIGHSMGCALAAILASDGEKETSLQVPVVGFVAMCPRAHQLSLAQIKAVKRFFTLPDMFIDLLRWFDRIGGPHSKSVNRVVRSSDETPLRHMQFAWNRQFRTAVLRRETLGLLPETSETGERVGGWPGKEYWSNIRTPTFLIAGKDDIICKPEEVGTLLGYMMAETAQSGEIKTHEIEAGLKPKTFKSRHSVVQKVILPSPAAHALPYAHATYRLVNALIENFLSEHVSHELDFTYQLQLLTTSGKWDVKNLEKWKKVKPVSGPIDTHDNENGLFRVLKTMRQQDDEHNPSQFVQNWGNRIYCVIDLTHDAPIYDSKILETGGVEYHKFPTVSKVPPSRSEVHDFCNLVDRLLHERDAKNDTRAIGTSCHYGSNRSGFFVASYLITRRGYKIQDAIDEFKSARPPGIKHAHFIDMLWLRYSDKSQS